MEDLQLISVKSVLGKVVEVHNSTNHVLIGKGKQGAVFKISPERCVKIFATQKHFEQERDAYMRAQGSCITPKLYEIGPNYLIMEHIKGLTLNKHLEKKRMISIELTKQILFIFREMKRLGFTRLNVRLKHVIITQEHGLKIIDHVNSFNIKEHRPILLFNKLKSLGLLYSFLRQVKELDIETYSEWKQSMRKYFK